MDKESQLIDDAVKISHIPVTIIQGRYDIVCPPGTAWELYKVILTFNSPIKIKINKNTVSTSKRKIREGGNIETPN